MNRRFLPALHPGSLAGLLALLTLVPDVPATPTPSEGSHFAVIAYYGGRGKGIEGLPVGKLTHIIYSFLHLRGDSLSLDGPRDSAAIASLVALKKENPQLKVMLSLGGWGGCAPCSETFASPRGRSLFAASTLRLLARTGTDGIDIDWEYPVVEGYPGHRYSPDDGHNFTLLVEELRATLGEKYELSFAAGGYSDCILRSIEWRQVMPRVDRVNVMTYDLVNANSTVTGHQTPLFSSPSQKESVDNAVRLLDSLGVAPEKIVIGSAFYARVWEGVRDTNNGLFEPGRFIRYVPYRDLDGYLRQSAGFKAFWDSTSAAPYSYSAQKGLFATYDDPRSAALKTAYALQRHLGGIMFWEITGDIPLHGLLSSIDSVRRATSNQR